MPTPNTSLASAITAVLDGAPEHAVAEDAAGPMSAAACLARAEARRRQMAAAGIGPGARVYIWAGRGSDYWVDMLAVWGLDATAVPVDAGIDSARAAHLFERAPPACVLGAPVTLALPPSTRGLGDTPAAGGAAALAIAPPEHPAAILFTSGSTGDPKGVVLCHAAMLGNSRAILAVLDLNPGDRLAMATPYAFTSAICHFLAAALSGATLVGCEDRLFAADLVRTVRDARPTCFGGAPIQLQWLAAAARREPLPLRWVMSSGDHLRASVIHDLREAMPGTDIYTVYGLTETGGRFCALPPHALPAAAGAVGTPIAGMTVTVRDDAGHPLADGIEGEVYADGAYLFDGYFRDDAATDAALTPAGLRTGDLGYMGDDGWLRLTGRADDVFKSSGQKVSSIPIVDTLMATGLFDDVAIVPEAHPALGHVASAVYVLKAGTQFDRRAVIQAVRDRLPANHVPHRFVAATAIPRTGSGKIRRRELAALVARA